MRWVRLFVAVLGLLAISSRAGAQVSYTVSFLDSGNNFTDSEKASMSSAVQAAGADWARYFQTPGPVNLTVQIELYNPSPRMTGRSGDSTYVNTANGINVFEQSAGSKVRTGGPTVTPADILLTMNTTYLRDNLWFEPNMTARTAQIPTNRTDAYTVMLHELGHAFYMNGWRTGEGDLTTTYQSTWDRHITRQANGEIHFTGPNAMEVYGGPVAVTNGNPNHYGNASGFGSNLVAGYNPGLIQETLMNGVVFWFQNRLGISALDLALAKDAGLTLAPFRWTGTSGAWMTASNWNAVPNAGVNIVVPKWTVFDARIDKVTGTPYTVTLAGNAALGSFELNSADATLSHTAGDFSVTTGTLTSGVYSVNGGTVNGGAWSSGVGAMRFSSNTANTIANATLGAGVLDLAPANSYAKFTGTTNFGTNAAGTTVGTNSVLALDQATMPRGTITLAGGAVAVEGNRSAMIDFNTLIRVAGAGATGSVGRWSAVSGTGNLTNQGVLEATGANSVMTINPTGTFTNSGIIRTTDPTARVNIQPGGAFTNNGTVNAYGTVTGGVTHTGGTFKLNGTITGQLVASGGSIGSGPIGPGLLTVGSASFRPGAAYAWQVKDWSAGAVAGVGFDRITSAGSLDLSQLSGAGKFSIAIVGLTAANVVGAVPGFDASVARSWVIADFTNPLTGNPNDLFQIDASQFTASNNLNGGAFSLGLTPTGDVVLTFTPVPEPSLVLALAALGLGIRRFNTKARRGRHEAHRGQPDEQETQKSLGC
ncbi:MAG TPA: hypothetical protein VMZ71_00255 [Gemmataceae bacterium]|nr:hypothetical protein [Gemmataceae bacterium]